MAKSLLLNVLVEVLGKYVEGLSRENLKVAVWSGTIDLSNLQLKRSALDSLNLPIKVERGSLKRVHLKIPWASLESKPVIVEIDGLYLQAGPQDVANLTPEDAQRMIAATQNVKLKEVEDAIMNLVKKKEEIQETAKKASYVQQLTAKIIDNLEVSVTNLHIRYEDATSISGTVFSCGVTIAELSLTTTDDSWTARFVSRDANKRKKTAIHKLGKMDNFGVYWNTSGMRLLDVEYQEWEKHMLARIFRSIDGQNSPFSPGTPQVKQPDMPVYGERMTYLLAPPNSFTMKVAHREICTETDPKLDVLMESTTIPFQINSDQFQQLMLVSQEFEEMDRRKLLIMRRPAQRPRRGESARDWWRYAYHLITGRHLSGDTNKLMLLRECLKARKMYVPYRRDALVRSEIIEPLLAEAGDADPKAHQEQLYTSTHEREEAQMKHYQETLPLSVLVTFHQLAAKEAVMEIMRLRNDPQLLRQYVDKYVPTVETKGFWGTTHHKKPHVEAATSTKTSHGGGGFFGWFKKKEESPVKPATPVKLLDKASVQAMENQSHRLTGDEMAEDEALMHDLEETLNKYSAEAEKDVDDAFTLRLVVHTSAVLSVLLRRQPVAFFDLGMHTKVEVRRIGTQLLFEMDKLAVEDNISVKPVHKYLLSVLEGKDQDRSRDEYDQATVRVPRIEGSGGLTSPVKYEQPKFAFVFETSNGQSSLRLQSFPIKVVLNEPCVRGLLTCFASPVPTYTTNAPLLFQSMNAISARFTVPETSSLDIVMEVYAPTVIIPEEFDSDSGCAQLDTGKLLVNGHITPNVMTWDIVVRAVNIAMPSSGTVDTPGRGESPRSLDSGSDLYLVKPFDVKAHIRKAPQEDTCDLVIALDIAPAIEGQLDALKLIRLKYTMDVVMRAIKPVTPEEGDVSGGEESRKSSQQDPKESWRSPRMIYDSDAPMSPHTLRGEDAYPAPTLIRRGEDVDFTRVTLNMNIRLPRIAIALWIADDHSAELSVSDVDLTIVQRAGDMNLQVTAQCMALTDSQRPEEHRAILWTSSEVTGSSRGLSTSGAGGKDGDNGGDEPADSDGPIIKVAYRELTTPLSPLYNGNQTEIFIVMSTLRCGIDSISTERYVPFANSLLEHYSTYYGSDKGMYTRDNEKLGSSGKQIKSGPGTASDTGTGPGTASGTGPGSGLGSRRTMKMLNARPVQAPTGPPPFGGSQFVVSVSAVSLDLLQEVQATPGQRSYERAFSTEVRDIFVQYRATTSLNEATAHIAAVEVKDVRQSSAEFVYNTLVTRNVESQILSDTSPSTPGSTTSDSDDLTHPDKIIAVRFTKQLNTLLSTVEVYLQDVTSYVSVDIIMAFVELLLANVNAFTGIITAINGEQDITQYVMQRLQELQESSANTAAAALRQHIVHDSMTNLDEIKENLNLTVVVVNPRLVLLENPAKRTTKAIVSDCAIAFHFSQETLTAQHAKRVQVCETFHVSLQRAQVFVLSNLEEAANPHKIVAPTGIDVVVKRQSENGVVLTTSLNIGSEPIAARVSLNDIVLTNAIIARAQLTPSQPPTSPPDDDETGPTQAASAANEAQSLTLLQVQFNMSTISVVLLNDYRDANIPMFRVILDHLSFNSSGAIGSMEGEGSMLVNADFYNTAVATWEPVLEPWVPSIIVRRNCMGIELSINSRGVMQLNVTGAMCNGIYTCLALLNKIGQEGVADERKRVYPLVVRNYLGTPLELFDCRTGRSLAVLMDGEPFDVPAKEVSAKERRQGSYRKLEFPDLFELRIVDEQLGQRVPITQIPSRSLHTRLYHFMPVNVGVPSNKNLQSEPITEEVFENQRYRPLHMAWGDPWTNMADPAKWTDARGNQTREPSRVPLPKDWEWVDNNWRVDVGKVGVETDADGWFYSSAFCQLTAARKGRRAHQPLDVVRRRRWIRTRAPKAETVATAAEGGDMRPIPVFWDVQIKSDEATEICIASGMEFRNNAPCAVEVQMLDVRGDPIEGPALTADKGQVLRMPYIVVGSNQLRVRPLEQGFGWSEVIPCKLKIDETDPHLQSVETVACKKPNYGSINLVVHVRQENKRVILTCSGCAMVHNRLPCPLSVLFSAPETGVESNALEAGEDFSITKASADPDTELSFAVGDFGSVQPVRIKDLKPDKELTVWLKSREDENSGAPEPDLLSLIVKASVTEEGVLDICAHSQYMLIDQSDLAVSVFSNTCELPTPASTCAKHPTDWVVRRTYQDDRKYSLKPILQQVQSLENISAAACWAPGMAGVTLFQSGKENTVSLGVNCGSGVLKDVSLDGLTIEKAPVEIVDQGTGLAYNLALTLSPLPGPLACTSLLRVMPAYTIVNNLDEAIELLHPTEFGDANRGFRVEPRSGRTWHRVLSQPGTAVRLRTDSTCPSLCTVDMNEIGANLLLLPSREGEKERSNHTVAHVEVKFSEADESSYITVVIWRAEVKKVPGRRRMDTSTAMLSVHNETDFLVSVLQDGVQGLVHAVSPAVVRRCELLLQANEWQPYGWIDASLNNALAVTVTNNSGDRLNAVINTLLVNQEVTLGGVVTVSVRMVGNGKVVCIRKVQQQRGNAQMVGYSERSVSPPKSPDADRSGDLVLKLHCQSIGISLVAELPTRRELFSAYVESVETYIRRAVSSGDDSIMTSVDLKVRDIHVDNYIDSAFYPVLACSTNSDERVHAAKRRRRSDTTSTDNTMRSTDSGRESSNGDELTAEGDEGYRPFLRFSAMWEQPRATGAVVVKYLAMRALEVKVALDTSSILIYFLDLNNDLIQQPLFIDSADPRGVQRFFEDFNAKVLDTQLYHINGQDVDPQISYTHAQANKYFFEALIIHPLKISITFTPTHLPSDRKAQADRTLGMNNKLRLLPRIAAVEDFALKVNSFIVDHAMESVRSMQQRIGMKILHDLKKGMLHIVGHLVGSMALFGKPAGLYRNIGGGVSDFFYEPYQGIMESPQAFIFGLGKGTGALMKGVASGVVGTAASLVTTATGGVSTITEGVAKVTGDDKYLQRREQKMRAAKAKEGGVLTGLQAGGESVVSGVAYGISGLVTKPYEEGKKGGALGVMKGMGMGILGVATKPVMGVADGITSVATGFQQQLQDPQKTVSHVRPRRSFERTEERDNAPPVLRKYDQFSAEAQQYIEKRKTSKGYDDMYLASCTLGYSRTGSRSVDAAYGVALSKKYVFELSGSLHKLWKISWAQLSHVILVVDGQGGAVDFLSYGEKGGHGVALPHNKEDNTSRRIQCASRAAAIRLYATMTRFAYKMGNAAAVIPLESLRLNSDGEDSPHETSARRRDSAASGTTTVATASTGVLSATQQLHAAQRRGSGTRVYQYGMANTREYRIEKASETQIFENTRARLAKITLAVLEQPAGADKYAQLLDDALWRLISEWRYNHNIVFNPSRCAACLVVNHTPHYVQFTDFDLKEGKDYKIFGVGDGYDQDSRSLVANGGAAIVFAFGGVPTLTDLAHVKLQLFTTAFQGVMSTRRNRTDVSNQNGYSAGYAEKVQADYWAKSVIVITSVI